MRKISINKILLLLITTDLLFVSAYIIFNNLSFNTILLEVVRNRLEFWFDVNGEGNIISWYSSSKFLLAGLLLGIIFLIKGYFSALFGSLLLTLMSADEGGQIHENLGLILSSAILSPGKTVLGSSTQHDWPYVVGPIVAVVTVLFIYTILRERSFSRRSAGVIMSGLGILLAGAVGMEIVSHKLSLNTWWFRPDILEELLELLGSSVILLGCGLAPMPLS